MLARSMILLMSLLFSDGVFGAYMQVSIQNDGPVTIQLESPNNLINEVKS